MKTQFTPAELAKFFSGEYKHSAYAETVELAEKIKVHSEGKFPEKLVSERRPSESQTVLDYRKLIWEPITEPTFSKILTSLNKIRRSADWSIKFDVTKVPESIREGESLSDYLTLNFPYFTSLTNWAFGVLLKAYCVDANALICVYPIEFEVPGNEFRKPFPYLYYSDQVVEFKEGNFAVVRCAEKIHFSEDNAMHEGDAYYVITKNDISRHEQIKKDRTFQQVQYYAHNLGVLPVIKTRGVFKEAKEDTFIFKSRLSAIIPRLNEALREYSDLQAEVVQHIFSEKYEYVTDECRDCKGKGKVETAGFKGGGKDCQTCNGSGNKPRGPFTTLQIKAGMAGENNSVPTPPIGYVQKQVEIVRIQDERIDKHIYQALSAVNMEFLAKTPLNESGIAKAYDGDELNTFAHSIAEDLVSIMDSTAFFTNEYRYREAVKDQKARNAMLPTIAVPEKFDILSSGLLESQVKSSKDNNLNPVIINAMEIEYANKKFNNDPSVRNLVTLTLQLDPLAGVSDEDKMVRYSNKWITEETAIISANIQEFIARAIDENGEKFFGMELKDKKKLMQKYAQEQIKANSPAAVIIGPDEE